MAARRWRRRKRAEYVLPPRPITCELLEPAANSYFIAPAEIKLRASVFAANDEVAKVEFLKDGAVVASRGAKPYEFLWSGVAPGSYRLSARATTKGGVSAKADARVQVAHLAVTLAARDTEYGQPLGDLGAPAMLSLRATPSVHGTALDHVDFIASGTVIGRINAAPYEFGWQNVAPGSYQVIARAYGSNGATADSAPVTIKVAPLWVMLDPTTPEQLNAPGRAFLGARTKAWQSGVERIEYYAGSTLLGSGTAISPQFEWKDIPAGNYILTAKVYDSKGNTATSRPKTLNVLGPPTVQLIAPQNGSTAPAGGSITLEAEATAPGSRVNNVVFYRGATMLGSDASAPYQLLWTNLPLGTHTLTATTSTPQGLSATSAPITINVTNDPGASITAPRSGQSLPSGSPITVTVQATMPLRAIDRVELFADGTLLTTITANGAANFTANYSWTDAAIGPHVLKATAYAKDGTKVDTAEVAFTVVGPIKVNLESPIGLTTVLASDAVHFAAQASQEAGSIAAVEFLSGETLLARRMAPPYVSTWENPPQGVHWVTAKAIDGTGRVASTTPIAVRSIESETIEIAPGIDGATVDDDRIRVTGTVQAPNNSALLINGRAAAIDLLGNFFVNDVPLAPGSNVITATLSSEKRAKVANSLTVNSTGKASFRVSLDRYRGKAPITGNLFVSNPLGAPFASITILAEGSNEPEKTITSLPGRQLVLPLSYEEPGLYPIKVIVFDSEQKAICQTTIHLLALDSRQIANLVSQVYGSMLGRLRTGKIDQAVELLSQELRVRTPRDLVCSGTTSPMPRRAWDACERSPCSRNLR